MTTDRADRLAAIAIELVGRVRDDEPEVNGAWLRERVAGDEWLALCIILAAAVPPCDHGEWLRLTSWASPRTDPTHIDEIAVERACRGERVELTRAERYAAIDKLERRKMSAKAIARVLGISSRTVVRRRHTREGYDIPARETSRETSQRSRTSA